MFRAGLLGPALLLICLTGCESGSAGTTVVTDSAGLRLVMNSGEDVALDWRFTPVLTLGGADSGPGAFFEANRGNVGTDGSGNLYVLDEAGHRVVVFDSTGRHLRTMGHEGEGPGELSEPRSLSVRSDGTVFVRDFGKGTLVGFAPTGAPLPDEKRFELGIRRIWAHDGFYTSDRSAGEDRDYSVLLYITDSDTTELARLVRTEGQTIELESCGLTVMSVGPIFAPEIVWDAGPGGAVSRGGAAYSVDVYDAGRLLARYRRNVAPVEATPELALRQIGEVRTVHIPGVGELRCDPAEVIEQQGFATEVPAIRALRIAPDGTIWVSRGGPRPEPTPTDILAPDGTYLGTLPAEVPFPIRFLPDGRPLMTETDDIGVSRLVLYEIEKAPSGIETE